MVAFVPKLRYLFDDGLRVAAPLASAGKRNHTERTHIVTATGDAHKGGDAVSAKANRFDVMVRLFFAQDDVDGLASAIQLLEQVGQVAVGVGTHHQVHKLFFVKELFTNALSHAAQNANLEFGILGLERVELIEAVAHGLLGLFANRAGIQQHQIGLLEVVRGLVPVLLKDGCDDLAVRKIHLAPVGLEVELLALTQAFADHDFTLALFAERGTFEF